MTAFKSAIYGWSIVWKPTDQERWCVDDHEEGNGLPAVFEDWEMAVDRLKFLESKGVAGRMVAVLVHPSDFEIDGTNKFVSGFEGNSVWWPHISRKKRKRKGGNEGNQE